MKHKFFIHFFGAAVITFLVLANLSPDPARAGWKEAQDAYDAKDYKTAFKEYLPLAEAGESDAQFWIGNMYRFGLGRTINYKKTVYWFFRAAENGDIAVIGDLGYMAGKGQGMKASKNKEICFYRLAAERGYRDAQWNLYMNLSDSFFTITEANEWLKRAVKQGQDNALARQGALLIVDPLNFDKTEGLMYLVLAQKYGDDPEVDEYIDEIVGNNPSRKKELERAKVLANKWKSTEEPDPQNIPAPDIKKCLNA